MVQIPINPFDNDRLKTRKVQQMLDDLGVLPEKHDQRPTFLRSRRTAAVLIDRALNGLAVDPSAQKHCCKSSNDFVAAINSKFMAAYQIDVGNGPVDPFVVLDLKNGVYTFGADIIAVTDVLVSDTENSGVVFDQSHITSGVGWVGAGRDGSGFYRGAKILNLFEAFSIFEGCTIILTVNIGGVVNGGGSVTVEMFDAPDWSTDFNATLDGTQNQLQGYTGSGNDTRIFQDTSGITKMAINIAPGVSLTGSLNGSATQSAQAIVAGAINQFTIFVQASNGGTSALEQLALYPLQDAADLPALSALS